MNIIRNILEMIDHYGAHHKWHRLCCRLGHCKEHIDLIWYDGSPPTKERIAELRYKLAVARGMLGSVRDMMANVEVGGQLCVHVEDLDKAMKETID